MESSPAVAGNTIQYTAMDYCKGRAERRHVSHRSLPGHLQLSHVAHTLSLTMGGGLSSFQRFPKPLTLGPVIKIRAGIVFSPEGFCLRVGAPQR